jgi:hypothetical protein
MFSAFKKLTSKTDLPGQNGTAGSPQAAGVQSMSYNLQKKFAKVFFFLFCDIAYATEPYRTTFYFTCFIHPGLQLQYENRGPRRQKYRQNLLITAASGLYFFEIKFSLSLHYFLDCSLFREELLSKNISPQRKSRWPLSTGVTKTQKTLSK